MVPRAIPIVLICLLLTSLGRETLHAQPRRVVDSLIGMLNKPRPDTAQVQLLNAIGFRSSSQSADSGLSYARKALALAERIGWKRGIAHAYNTLGTCLVYQSDFTGSIESFNRSLKLFESIEDTSGMLKAIGNLGAIYIYQSNFVQALKQNLLALKYAEALGDTSSITINLGNIGAIYECIKEYDKGLEYNFRCLKIISKRGDSGTIALVLGNIGNLYTDKKEYAQALQYQHQALDIHERLGMKPDAVRDMLSIGSTYQGIKAYGKALRILFHALEVPGTKEFQPLRASILSRLGSTIVSIAKDSFRHARAADITPAELRSWNIRLEPQQLAAAAVPYLQESIAADSAMGNINSLQDSYKDLADAQRILGHFEDAMRSHEKYVLFKDSVYSLDNKAQIANMEIKREAELKDKQIELDRLAVAKKRNERVFFISGFLLLLVVAGIVFRNIRLKNAKELSENKLSAFQARMNPHFIFNSLNSIQSLVLSGETISSITYLSRFSKLMRQILDSSGRSKALLQDEIDMLRSYVELEQLRFDRFSFEIDVAADINAGALEVPTMIIQPFVENAIIHGILPRRDEGLLRISFERRGQTIVCTVDDNGIGRVRSAALNAARRSEHKSQGIAIATNRLSLLGKRSTDSAVRYIDKEADGSPSGTTVILQIPLL